MKRSGAGLVVTLAIIGGYGCAAAPMRAEVAPAPVVAAPPPPAPAAGEMDAPAPATSVVSPADRQRASAGATADLVAAQRELQASAGNCQVACRALASLDRAAGRLCALVASPPDQRTCDDARGKLVTARDRVRSACGSCPGGPTVDPTAPTPTP